MDRGPQAAQSPAIQRLVADRPAGIRPYTPASAAAAELAGRTVGNESIVRALERRLLQAALGEPAAPLLLTGPAGAGKSHLLRVAVHRAGERAGVSERLVVASLGEDLVGISRLDDLLGEVLARLTGEHHHRFGAGPEQAIGQQLGGRSLALVVENLDRVLAAFTEADRERLGDWLNGGRQVALLASAERSLTAPPGWADFQCLALTEPTLDQLRALLVGVAEDQRLLDFLGSPPGLARLRALAALVGRAPRSWTQLAGVLSTSQLERLWPAVEAVIEAQVPHQRWLVAGLSPIEQRLVRALATGPGQAWTVVELAGRAGISQRSAATTLGRLAEAGWVVAAKAPGLDQRSSWYRLADPLLRAHLHHRDGDTRWLQQLVQILRAWHDDPGPVKPGPVKPFPVKPGPVKPGPVKPGPVKPGPAELVPVEPVPAELVPAEPSPVEPEQAVLATVRAWAAATIDPSLDAGEASALVELIMLAVEHDWAGVARLIDRGQLDAPALAVGRRLVTSAHDQDPSAPLADRFGRLLRQAAVEGTQRCHPVLELLSAGWDGEQDPPRTRHRLAILLAAGHGRPDAFGTALRREHARWTGLAGDPGQAFVQAIELLADPTATPLDPANNPALAVARDNLHQLVRQPEAGPDRASEEIDLLGLPALLVAALAGSPLAQVRLPTELAPIVQAARPAPTRHA